MATHHYECPKCGHGAVTHRRQSAQTIDTMASVTVSGVKFSDSQATFTLPSHDTLECDQCEYESVLGTFLVVECGTCEATERNHAFPPSGAWFCGNCLHAQEVEQLAIAIADTRDAFEGD